MILKGRDIKKIMTPGKQAAPKVATVKLSPYSGIFYSYVIYFQYFAGHWGGGRNSYVSIHLITRKNRDANSSRCNFDEEIVVST